MSSNSVRELLILIGSRRRGQVSPKVVAEYDLQNRSRELKKMRLPYCLEKLKKQSKNRWKIAEPIPGSVGQSGKWKNLRELMLEVVEADR